jgi:hypothetical protein
MIEPKLLMWLFDQNLWIIKRQVDGLTHEASLDGLPFRGNCLNWVLGHILYSRNMIHQILGQPPIWTQVDGKAYAYQAPPITADSQDVHTLEKLMGDLNRSQEMIRNALEKMSQNDMNQPFDDTLAIGERLSFLHFHEAYHAGQTEYLRQLVGKNDEVW